MKPLDKENLFSIFDKGDEEVYIEHGIEETLKNPFVLMGMVIRGLQNYELMDIMYQRNYPKEYKEVAPKLKYKYFCRLYKYLERIDLYDSNDVYGIGDSFDQQQVYEGLDALRIYFESIEEYEKCAIIKKFSDYLVDKVVSLANFSYI